MLSPDENYIPEEEVIPPQKFNLDEFVSGKPFKIGAGVIFLVLAILVGLTAFRYFGTINNPANPIQPSPTPVVSTVTPVQSLSRWATDSGILKEQENLKTIDNDLKNLDLNESNLTFPTLDFNINFQKTQ